jgi:hypothetical protein
VIDFRKSTYSGGENTDCVEVATGTREDFSAQA